MSVVSPALTLASASPRRRDLLGYLGVAYYTFATDAEEREMYPPQKVIDALPPVPVPLGNHPTLLAWRKALVASVEAPDNLILAADTIVVLDGDVLNKPIDQAHAETMLARLSGRTHTVYTGLVMIEPVRDGEHRLYVDVVSSAVSIAALDPETIRSYVATGEPLDKAGAYGIQGLGGRLVRGVVGSYTNVVGLPLPSVHRLLESVGIQNLSDPSAAYHRWLLAQGKEALPCPPTSP